MWGSSHEAKADPWASLSGLDVERASSPAQLEVQHVSYAVKIGKKGETRKVLSGVTCSFPAGKMSAVMGASGSGKTSVLTLLRGLSSPGAQLVGDVACDGRRVSADMMRSVASVVPQEDVYLAALTPREMLGFAAELRLPTKVSPDERKSRVDSMIASLKLETCADSKIGDEKLGLRGISGGEKRRLSVGLSIIGGLPQALLCDEPTSGLDSAAAASMITLLKALADRGVTVLCAIHQPSYAVFKEFSYLLLLEAGEICYAGDIDGVEPYFTKHNAPLPMHVNPAHHYVELVQESDQWRKRWQQEMPSTTSMANLMPPSTQTSGKSGLSMMQQTSVLTRRMLLENFKNKKKFFRGIMSRLPASITIGIFFWKVASTPTQQSIFPLKGVLFVAVQNPLIETFYAGATAFQTTKGLLKREYYDGLYQVLPYLLAYYMGFLAMQIPWTVVWTVPLYFFVGLPLEMARFSVFLFTTFFVIITACAAGSAVGAKTKDSEENRAVLAPMLIPMILFSGYVIPFATMSNVWKPLYFMSPVQWGMTILETALYKGVDFVDCTPELAEKEYCYATGEDYLAATTSSFSQEIGVGGMLMICCVYLFFFLFLNIRAIRSSVLNGRV